MGTEARKWHIEVRSTQYADLNEYTILEPNPDAGKQGVSYAGDYLRVCQLDSREDARLIASAPDLLEALSKAFHCLQGDCGAAFRDLHPATWRQMEAALAQPTT